MGNNGYRFCPYCATTLVQRMSHVACPDDACGFVHYDNPIPVVAAIVELPEGVVLAHARDWPPYMFSVPTGFVEAREDPAHAVRREVGEELGLMAKSVCLVGVFPFVEQNQVLLAYHIVAHGPVVLGEELDDYRIVPIDRLRSWNFGTGLAVQAWLDMRAAHTGPTT